MSITHSVKPWYAVLNGKLKPHECDEKRGIELFYHVLELKILKESDLTLSFQKPLKSSCYIFFLKNAID